MNYIPREISSQPSTQRVVKRFQELLESGLYIDSQRIRLYTEYMKEHWAEPHYTRCGGAFKYVLSNLIPVIRDGELIVGAQSPHIRGTHLYPEYEATWMREGLEGIQREEERYMEGTLSINKGEKQLGIFRLTQKAEKEIRESLEFWKEDWQSVSEKILQKRKDYEMVEKWQQQLVFFRFMWDVPEGRVVPDYQKVIDGGLVSIIELCQEKLAELGPPDTKEKIDKYDFYTGTILALEGVIVFAESYSHEAERMAENAGEERKKELLEIARICRKVPRSRADTFWEALQSFFFVHLALFIEVNGRGISPGRFDQYMYRPYKSDMDSGRKTESRALELLELLRIKHTEIVRAHGKFTESYQGGSIFQNLSLGGLNHQGFGADNELSKLILQAGINVKIHQPTISVKWGDKLGHDFKLKAVECIKAGSGYPALFNDSLGIRRLMNTATATLDDAREWVPCGCVDINSPQRPPQWCVAHFNALKLFEIVLNDGINPVTGDKLFETQIRAEEASYEQIKEEWIRLVRVLLKKEADYWNIAMVIHNKMGLTLPFLSALLDDCILKGLHCQEGGCRYNDSPYFITCGLINVANSLAAIKKCVFDDRLFSMGELRKALDQNFENGCEGMRIALLKAPKFGNADKYVDDIASELYAAYAEAAEDNPNWLGDPWRPSTLSVTSQVVHGNACNASPDGRRAEEHVSDGSVSAYPGTDVSGPTALIRSAVHPDASKLQSMLFNMKINPSTIEGGVGSEKLISLIETYFDLGGYQIQFNIVDSKMLKDAQKQPEKYQDLMVRVAGFSARWVELGPAIQDEIIRRTEHSNI